MKLSHLYCNRPTIFGPVVFRDGLNVILGEVRRPDDRSEDTHNLGKTLLAEVIDFCLLRRKSRNFFLFSDPGRFAGFEFFLEISLPEEGLVTVRRTVDRGSKASFIRHTVPNKNFVDTPKEEWDHWEVPFRTAKDLLDGILDLRAVEPWSFRKAIAYSLRTQSDYDEPFSLAKFSGRHRDWKPFLAHILGLDSSLIQRHYDLVDEVAETKQEAARQRADVQGLDDPDKLRGLIAIREAEVERYARRLDDYNFDIADSEINRELVEELDREIAHLNERRYYLSAALERTETALAERVTFDLDRIRRLFEDSKIYFGDALQRDYENLVEFNAAITEERNAYLRSELKELEKELANVASRLSILNAQRAAALVTLRDHEAFSKFKDLSRRLVDKRATLESLRRQEAALEALAATRRRLNELERDLAEVRDAIEANLESGSDRYRDIRQYFNDVISKVIDQGANLYTNLNQEGNPDFHVELVDESGQSTKGAKGHTYGRLLCIAFDMSVQRAYVDALFPHFIYHDGIFESLDDRKKLNLVDVIREYCALGIQHVVTVIHSELPSLVEEGELFTDEEVILRLHDQDDTGRLFRTSPW